MRRPPFRRHRCFTPLANEAQPGTGTESLARCASAVWCSAMAELPKSGVSGNIMKYLLSRLLEPSTWIGMAIIISALIAPRWFTVLLGAILIISGDAWLKSWVQKYAPAIAKSIEEI